MGSTLIKRRKFLLAVNSIVGSGIALIVGGMICYLSCKYFKRIEIGSSAHHTLSHPTKEVLGRLTNRLEVIVLFDKTAPLFELVDGLLREYRIANPNINVVFVDYTRDPGQAAQLAVRYSLAKSDSDTVIFVYNDKHRLVRASELSEYNVAEWLAGKSAEIRRTAFRGEMLFTSAIASLLLNKQPICYFITGHGEHDPDDDSRIMGYSGFKSLLEGKGAKVLKCSLVDTKAVPADCSLLIIAGPKTAYDSAELLAINDYILRGGRLLCLLSFYQAGRREIGLEALLQRFGVAVGMNFVFDPGHTLQGTDIICTNFSTHKIMLPLRGYSLYVLFPRSISPLSLGTDRNAIQVEPLFMTSPAGFTASRFTAEGAAVPEPTVDMRGSVSLAVAAEGPADIAFGGERTNHRIVVIGDSIFCGNETIVKLGNWEFMNSVVDWLLEAPGYSMPIAPKPIREYPVHVTTAQLKICVIVLLFILPGIILLFGAGVWWWRRS